MPVAPPPSSAGRHGNVGYPRSIGVLPKYPSHSNGGDSSGGLCGGGEGEGGVGLGGRGKCEGGVGLGGGGEGEGGVRLGGGDEGGDGLQPLHADGNSTVATLAHAAVSSNCGPSDDHCSHVIRAPHEQVIHSASAAATFHTADVHEAVPQWSGHGDIGGAGGGRGGAGGGGANASIET